MSDAGFASPLLSLVDQGVGLLFGTVDDQHAPRGTRAWGVRVVGDRVLRVTFSADDPGVIANAAHGVVAITGADVRELKSAQLKGRVHRLATPDEDDLDVAAAHTQLFLQAIHETDLHDLRLLRRFLPTRILAVEVEIRDAFDQTPGPTAGVPLDDSGTDDAVVDQQPVGSESFDDHPDAAVDPFRIGSQPSSAPADEMLELDDMAECYEGGVPAVICTADLDGVPNITYLSRVHPVDRDRIAISNQFMSKTSRNIAVNPVADLLLINPQTYEEFRIASRYERTERRGPVFERLRDDIDTLAEVLGLQGVFHLRAADIHRVISIDRVGQAHPDIELADAPPRSLAALADFTESIQRAPDLGCLVEVAIRGVDEVLGYRHVALLLLDESGRNLYTIASRGFGDENIGAEVAVGDGPIGGPLGRCEVQRSSGLRQLSKYGRTVRSSFEASGVRPGHDVPLPTLSDVNSRIVVPLRSLGQLVGGLVVEHRALGAFTADDERCLTIAAAALGTAIEQAQELAVRESDLDESTDASTPEPPPPPTERPRVVRCFDVDGSVFIDDEYIIKGVAGRILRSLVTEHLASGRTAFTNRELRLDRSLDLPGFKDNLESRLLLLKRRLDERDAPLRIDKTARGRFAVDVRQALALEEITAAD